MITRTRPPALGNEVMTVTDDPELTRLLREARDEAAAMAGLEENVDRLRRARAAQTVLAGLPPEQLRAALRMRRADLEGERR